MITPRVTRLVRVPDHKAMRAAIAQLAVLPDLSACRTAVVVPTRGAAEELRVSLERRLDESSPAMLLPDLVTRGELYRRFHAALAGAPRLLTESEREVLLRRAARDAANAGARPPFRLRPGLIVQMLDFYDELRRREQTLDDFERLATAPLLASAEMDRGAERLLRQTEFLCAAFAAFERLMAQSGGIDEHGLRALLLDRDSPQRAYEHVVITVADRAGDLRGLHGSDFDLLTRIDGLAKITVIATENLLASGLHERLHGLLPGLEEDAFGAPVPPPVLIAPETSEPDVRWFVCRDREEELVEVVRWLRHRAASSHESARPPALDRFGIVFQRPLPYLYLARQVFDDGRMPYQALDALPLAAEPFSATIDVILSFLASQANRTSVLELLRSPHLVFSQAVSRRDIAALDAKLRELAYSGGWDRLSALVDTFRADARSSDILRALESVHEAAQVLAPVVDPVSPAAQQFDTFLQFIKRFERLPEESAPWVERHLRARAAVLAALESVRDAHALHDETPLDLVELSGSVRRWIEAHTFSPRTGNSGVRLLDAASAPYSDLDELRIVGLVEGDWPEPAHRSIFYPASILSSLGWPADASQAAAARSRFHDLLTAAHRHVSVSVFTLEDDAIVPASPLLEEIEAAGLPMERWPVPPPVRVFTHEFVEAGVLPPAGELPPKWELPPKGGSHTVSVGPAKGELPPKGGSHTMSVGPAKEELPPEGGSHTVSVGPVASAAITPVASAFRRKGDSASEWLALRRDRTPPDDRRFGGFTGPRAPRTYAVSYLERYLDCPFKYFAHHVLKLPEERDEGPGLTPIERGHLIHEVFETFFREWQAAGHSTITTANVADALELFEAVADRKLERLPETDRALERNHLLGSAAASGLAERAFAFEIEQGGQVVERLLEHELEGEYTFTAPDGARRIRIKAKADRIDLMADGTIRIVDYKLGRAPKASRSLQLPIYGVIAQQALEGYRGRSWSVGAAGYVAFKEKEAFVPLGGRTSALDTAIADGQQRMLAAIDGIERGEFPVKPDEPFRCQWCGYAGVCRKDYVGDE